MERLERNTADSSVMIGFPCGPNVPWQTAASLAYTTHACGARGIPLSMAFVATSSIVIDARACVVHHFLSGDKKYLFWIDSDVTWREQDFLRVLALAQDYGVVCATYPLKRPGKTQFVVRHEREARVSPHGLVEVLGVGLGFTCIRRDIVEAVVATKGTVTLEGAALTVPDVFRLDKTDDGRRRGEDIGLFEDIRALGHTVWLDPTVQVGHVGTFEYIGDPVEAMGLEHLYGG